MNWEQGNAVIVNGRMRDLEESLEAAYRLCEEQRLELVTRRAEIADLRDQNEKQGQRIISLERELRRRAKS